MSLIDYSTQCYAAPLHANRHEMRAFIFAALLPSHFHYLICCTAAPHRVSKLLRLVQREVCSMYVTVSARLKMQAAAYEQRNQLLLSSSVILDKTAIITPQDDSGSSIDSTSHLSAENDQFSVRMIESKSVASEQPASLESSTQSPDNKMEELAEEIRLLKQQLALLAMLNQHPSPITPESAHLFQPDDPIHSSVKKPSPFLHPTIIVPEAPSLSPQQFLLAHSRASKLQTRREHIRQISLAFDQIPTAPMLNDLNASVDRPDEQHIASDCAIPEAPVLDFIIPQPPMLSSFQTSSRTASSSPSADAAPMFCFPPPNTSRNILADLNQNASKRALQPSACRPAATAPSSLSMNQEILNHKLKPRPVLLALPSLETSPSAPHLSNNIDNRKIKVFTRQIEGSEALSHCDLIKVASKLKLRSTACPRSPGGTPQKIVKTDISKAGIDPSVLSQALLSKFKNVQRSSFGRNKENSSDSWNTDE